MALEGGLEELEGSSEGPRPLTEFGAGSQYRCRTEYGSPGVSHTTAAPSLS